MKILLPLLLVIITSPYVNCQVDFELPFSPQFSASCDTDFTIWRVRDFCEGPTTIYPEFFPNSVDGQVLDDCALPDEDGFTSLAAIYNNPELVQYINQSTSSPSAAFCYAMEWEVTGGNFVDCGGASLGKKICFGGSSTIGLISCSLCPGVPYGAINNNPSAIGSHVRVKWSNENNDSEEKYGVKVKLVIQASSKRKFKLKKIIDGFTVITTVSDKIKTTICESFIPYGADTRSIDGLTSTGVSCAGGGGSRTVLVTGSPTIDRCSPQGVEYDVEIAKGDDPYQFFITSIPPTFTLTGLDPFSEYRVRVTPVFHAGFMGPSIERTFPPIDDFGINGPDIAVIGSRASTIYDGYGILNPVWSSSPSDLVNFPYSRVTGLALRIIDYPELGPASITISGTTPTCGLQVSATKRITLTDEPQNRTAPTNDLSVTGSPTITFLGNETQEGTLEYSPKALSTSIEPSLVTEGQKIRIRLKHQVLEKELIENSTWGTMIINQVGQQVYQNKQKISKGTVKTISTGLWDSGVYFIIETFNIDGQTTRKTSRILVK